MNDQEFKVGDTVTYKPYETAHKMEVKSIRVGGIFGNIFPEDNRVFYLLGLPGTAPDVVTTDTTGASITESRLFEPYLPSFLCKFKGRLVGSIGVMDNEYSLSVKAKDKQKATVKLYGTHEHISSLVIRESLF